MCVCARARAAKNCNICIIYYHENIARNCLLLCASISFYIWTAKILISYQLFYFHYILYWSNIMHKWNTEWSRIIHIFFFFCLSFCRALNLCYSSVTLYERFMMPQTKIGCWTVWVSTCSAEQLFQGYIHTYMSLTLSLSILYHIHCDLQ